MGSQSGDISAGHQRPRGQSIASFSHVGGGAYGIFPRVIREVLPARPPGMFLYSWQAACSSLRAGTSALSHRPTRAVFNHDFDKSILDVTAHRPWPMPERPWLMTQSWHDLLFAHWQVGAGRLRQAIPADFELDLFDGTAWLGVVPFYMTNVAARGTPSLPWISAFAELNVRTYVRVGDRPGIYFFSLDAARRLAVGAARAMFNLPYFTAAMHVGRRQDLVTYNSERRGNGNAKFRASYAPVGPVFAAAPGSLEHFLTERYCLYHHDHRRRPYRLDIHHPPWPLQPARAEVTSNTMAAASGLEAGGPPALLHFSRRQDMVAWSPTLL